MSKGGQKEEVVVMELVYFVLEDGAIVAQDPRLPRLFSVVSWHRKRECAEAAARRIRRQRERAEAARRDREEADIEGGVAYDVMY